MASFASKIARHYKNAAEHNEAAAQYHRETAKRLEAAETEKAVHRAIITRGHAIREHEATTAHAEIYIKIRNSSSLGNGLIVTQRRLP
jgi:hypothetical protein